MGTMTLVSEFRGSDATASLSAPVASRFFQKLLATNREPSTAIHNAGSTAGGLICLESEARLQNGARADPPTAPHPTDRIVERDRGGLPRPW